MNQARFEQMMARLEKEREEFVSRLSPERQKEYRQKEEELNQQKQTSNKAGQNQKLF